MFSIAKNNIFNFVGHKKSMNTSFLIKNKLFELPTPAIMGIINLTDNSFYSGSRIQSEIQFTKKVTQMIEEGADIIDLGAFSSQPGADYQTAKDEIPKLIPALTYIKTHFPDTLVSIDTVHSEVAKLCAKEGADLINDVSAGTYDNKMFATVAGLKIPYIMMHMQGTPKTMQISPSYKDVVKDINFFFSEHIEKAHQSGIYDIIIDPGFGFGKTIEQNYEILQKLSLFQIHEKPILVGLSRKSMLYKVLNTTPENTLTGTIALNTIALIKGASILRVHDVKEAKDVIKVVNKLKK